MKFNIRVITFTRLCIFAMISLTTSVAVADNAQGAASAYQYRGIAPVVNQDSSAAINQSNATSSGSTNSQSQAMTQQNTQQQPIANQSSANQAVNNQGPALTTSQQLTKIRQQLDNLSQLNLVGQLQNLQQQIQDLRGQLQVQGFQLKKLSGELKQAKVAKTTATTAAKINGDSQSVDSAKASVTSQVNLKQATGFLKDQTAYENAYELIPQKKYNQAVPALVNYLKMFPNGKYRVNAHYWLGELYLLQNKDRLAVNEFHIVVAKYPNSDKTADSMLKLGFIYFDNGQLLSAKRQLKEVVKKYPNTTVSSLAKARLQDVAVQLAAGKNKTVAQK